MSYRLEDQPEWAGPQPEDDFGTDAPATVSYPGPPRPERDPARAAIEANIAAEKAADRFKSTPIDATEIT